jgi:anti-anti-sigma factor
MSTPSTAVFSPRGRIDGTNAAAAESDLRALLSESGPNLVFDLGGIDYLSSAGLRVVLVAAKTCRAAGGKTVLAGARPAVQEILRMSGFDRIVESAPTVEQARALIA